MAEVTLVDTESALGPLVDRIFALPKHVPSLFIDLEGISLSRHGSLSLMTILITSEQRVYLVDVTTLHAKAFSMKSPGGRTLKKILESNDIIKVFFDIRNDSDALYALYKVRVRGIHDLQLMELAFRTRYPRKSVSGLAKCIKDDAGLTPAEAASWQTVKEAGLNLFAPERGGSYAVFDERPLNPIIVDYCAQDVAFMPLLYHNYLDKICDAWWNKITAETWKRIRLSRSEDYEPKGPGKAKAPQGWLHFKPFVRVYSTRDSLKAGPAERSRLAASVPASEKREIGDTSMAHLSQKIFRAAARSTDEEEEIERFNEALEELKLGQEENDERLEEAIEELNRDSD